MYTSWRRQETLNTSVECERKAAKVEREIMFYRAGYSATVPTWAKQIADDRSIPLDDMRRRLAKAYFDYQMASALRPRRKRSAMDIAADACGLKKVRVNGKTFYE